MFIEFLLKWNLILAHGKDSPRVGIESKRLVFYCSEIDRKTIEKAEPDMDVGTAMSESADIIMSIHSWNSSRLNNAL